MRPVRWKSQLNSLVESVSYAILRLCVRQEIAADGIDVPNDSVSQWGSR